VRSLRSRFPRFLSFLVCPAKRAVREQPPIVRVTCRLRLLEALYVRVHRVFRDGEAEGDPLTYPAHLEQHDRPADIAVKAGGLNAHAALPHRQHSGQMPQRTQKYRPSPNSRHQPQRLRKVSRRAQSRTALGAGHAHPTTAAASPAPPTEHPEWNSGLRRTQRKKATRRFFPAGRRSYPAGQSDRRGCPCLSTCMLLRER
jgi:hypothetical protein